MLAGHVAAPAHRGRGLCAACRWLHLSSSRRWRASAASAWPISVSLQGGLPEVSGFVVLSELSKAVAELDRCGCLVVPVAHFAVPVQRAGVVAGRFAGVAEVRVDLAEAVEGVGFSLGVAEVVVESEGTLAAGEGVRVVAGERQVPAERAVAGVRRASRRVDRSSG